MQQPQTRTLVRYLLDTFGTRAPSLSKCRICINRAQAQELISSGAVRVNGSDEPVTQFSYAVSSSDTVTISAEAIRKLRAAIRVWKIDKRAGIDCNLVEHKPDSLLHVLKKMKTKAAAASEQQSLFPVGRLDKDSEGLLLLTNSGPLCERLLHPDFVHEKSYTVELARTVNDGTPPVPARFWELMRTGVGWEMDGKTQTSLPCEVVEEKADDDDKSPRRIRFRITLRQGLNRQIRRMVEAAGRQAMAESRQEQPQQRPMSVKDAGYVVVFLRRDRFGPVSLEANRGGGGDDGDEIVELSRPDVEKILDWALGAKSGGSDGDAVELPARRGRDD